MSSENVSRGDESTARLRRVGLPAVLLAAVVIATFLPVARNGFLNYDDPDYVTANSRVMRGLTWENFVWAFRTTDAANWHPVTWLSHQLDVAAFGRNAAGHHLVSVVLHALTTALLFLLFRRMTGATGRSLVVAALFGLHPLRVESVAWATERKDVLAGLFAIATLLFYVRWAQQQSAQDRGRWLSYFAAVLCFAVGLMSKSMLVTLPGVMLLLDYWPLHRVSFPTRSHDAWRLLREKIPFFVLALATGVITLLVQGDAGAVKNMTSYPALARWENAFVSYTRYLGKIFYPADLAAFYPHPVFWPWLTVLCTSTLFLGISVFALRTRGSYPYLLVGWLWFIGTALPVIGLIQVGAQSIADRYTYLPSIGVLLALVWGACDLANAAVVRRIALPIAAAGSLGICALLTVKQIGYWRDSETLFRHAIAVTKQNAVAHINLGVALLDSARADEGLSELRTAVELAPRYADARLTLATALEKTGRYDNAITELDEAMRLSPRSARVFFEAGVVFDRLNRPSGAAHLFEEAIKRDPNFSEAHANLGVVLEKTGERERAAAEYTEALRLSPDNTQAHQNLGALLFHVNQTEKALFHFQRAVALMPESEVAHNNIAGALFVLGRLDEAVVEYKAALKLKPDYAEARVNLDHILQAKP